MRRQEYTLDPLPPQFSRLFVRLKTLAIALPALYILSDFYFGKHESGVNFENGREFTCHYRDFSFDPWIYKPLAWFERWLRGKRMRVQLFDESNPEGRAYGYGPYFE